MKNFIALSVLFLISQSGFATTNTIQLGSAIDRIQQNEYQDIAVESLRVTANAFTEESNPKLLGQWKKCFTRELNMPPMPLQKYIYTSISKQQNVEKLFVINNTNKTIEVEEDTLVSTMSALEKKLEIQTNGKCTLDVTTEVILKVFVKGLNETLTGRFFLNKVEGRLSIYFSEWKQDMSGVEEIKEFLPNKTPYNLSFPY